MAIRSSMKSRMRVATGRSSLRSWSLAVLAYSIDQAKFFPHILRGKHIFLPFANTLQRRSSQIVVLHFCDSILDNFSQIIGLCPASLLGQSIQPFFKLG